jgi:hypothetical protein
MDYSVTEQTTTTTYEPTTPHYSAPITAPKTERCDASVLSPAGPSARVSDVLTQSIGSDPGSVARPSPGLRLSGTYAGPGALRIEFRADSATLECGEAHVAAAYAVRDSGGQVSIAVHNSSARFVLALRSDGTLTGSGAVQVNGRIATGKNGTEIVYVPRTATCTLGTLSPLRAAR